MIGPRSASRISGSVWPLLVLALLVVSCTQATPDRPGLLGKDRDKILAYPDHVLDWSGYDGKDIGTASFTLDNRPIGGGQTGIDNLFNLIRAMPPGSRLNILPYISGEDGHTYPFDMDQLRSLTTSRNIILGIPSAA